MKREQFEKALEVNKELGRLKKHKEDLEKSRFNSEAVLYSITMTIIRRLVL
jgi:hypothetical protein